MRKIISVLTVLFLGVFVQAQNITMLDGNPRWSYGHYDDFHNIEGYSHITLGNDTVIGGLGYTLINVAQPVALREDSGIVFIYTPDLLVEKILYNFNLQVGDTMHASAYHYFDNSPFIVIESIDSMESPQGIRKVFTTNLGMSFYEGIGAQIHEFFTPQYIPSLSGSHSIICFEQNGLSQLNTPNATTGCANLSFEEYKRITPLIYPNPITDQLHIHYGFDVSQTVRLFDMQGKLIGQYSIPTADHFSIDLSHLHSGLYVLQGYEWTKKIVKE